MIVKKINITHNTSVGALSKFIIYYTDTRTGTPYTIEVTNMSGGSITATGSWPTYYLTNSNEPADTFSKATSGSASFFFQGNFDYLNITNYKGFNSSNVEIPSGAAFGFTISNVEVADLPPVPPPLPVGERTPIDSASKVRFVNSPIFIREVATSITQSVLINLYIWDGNLNRVISEPTYVLRKDKVSLADQYISLEISDLIRPFIKPLFGYNRAAAPAITNQGVFIQAEVIATNSNNTQTTRYTPTIFCTLGYRWNYEQNIIADNGVQNYGASGFVVPVNKWYNPKINNYFFQDFDFTKSVSTATTINIVRYNEVTPPANWLRCTRDPSLLVFINKLGLWETFTPHGKFTATTTAKRTDANIGHRDPSQVDNTFTHSRLNNSLDVKQSYLINTGSLSEDMTSIIEELIYSPKVYLIRFKGDIEETTTVGITIDSTLITIDDTNITIDNMTITEEALGFFKTHQQIPVIVADEDFTRKTRVNDMIAIDYNLKFDETNNKINSIR